IHLGPAFEPYKSSFAAWVAGLAGTTVGFPFDSVKSRLQTYKFSSSWDCIIETKNKEGLRGFFRGVTVPLISSSIVRSLSVTVYTNTRPIFRDFWYGDNVNKYEPTINTSPLYVRALHELSIAWLAGTTAGAACSIVACPFEFTKLAAQIEILVQAEGKSIIKTAFKGQRSTLEIARDLVKAGGPLALYSGYKFHLTRDLVGSAVYWSTYELFKLSISSISPNNKKVRSAAIAVGGAFAGMTCWCVVYPFDTYKSNIQKNVLKETIIINNLKKATGAERDSLLKMLKTQREINRSTRLSDYLNRAIYRGLGISMARTALIGITFFTCYENLLSIIA
ncbi:ornithine transporter of the mitochondrial inner membrane, partial [Nadsonia fulvescens var. elongata DSM 6958]